MASEHRNVDLLRMLLRRGASADQHDHYGGDVYVACNLFTRHQKPNIATSAKEIYDVLSEYTVPDFDATESLLSSVLRTAARHADGADIKALVALGPNLDVTNGLGQPALYDAVKSGNAPAYLELLEQGARWDIPACRAENLLFVALMRRDYVQWKVQSIATDFETIMRHLLRHRKVHLGTKFRIPDNILDRLCYPEHLWGHRTTPKQLAEAYGSETGAWFVNIVQEECCAPGASTDERRVLASRLEPCVVTGCGICREQTRLENDELGYDPDYVFDPDDAEWDVYGNQSCSSGKASEATGEEQFWDAEEGLQSI